MRRTSGNATTSVGKATSQDSPHAASQVIGKAGVGPRLFSVKIPETINVISPDSMSGITKVA